MRNILKNRWALSTVVTTLIILVVSVLLAGVVTYFAINVTSTRVQEESVVVSKQHIWYGVNGTQYSSEAAMMVINAGGRDVVFSKITCRGQTTAWGNVFYNITTAPVTGDLQFNTTLTNTGKITAGANQYEMLAATQDLILKSGQTMIIYIASPDSISMNDIGLTAAITLFTAQAMYYKETNVEAV